MSVRLVLLALLLAGCAATPSVVTRMDVRRAPREDPAARRAEDLSRPVTIDSDAMQRFGREALVVFTGNVIARQGSSVQYADRMEVYLDEKGDRIRRIVSSGNVRIVMRHGGEAKARRAEYDELRQQIVLRGNVRVWQGSEFSGGECIVIDIRWGTVESCGDAAELYVHAPAESEKPQRAEE
jgi:lipopolysaccharide transport protein LptA